MALYTNESKDRVRDAVDFLELVSARTELRRAGPARYEGLCPFHDERTPSFGIDPAQKVYYCFGCQASGDVFTFVQETEGVDFKGALELLAERYGVELQREEEDPKEAERRKRRERLLELLSRTAAYYERYLWESEEAARAREYLLGRGLGEEVLRGFRVGYAPSAWDRVLLASRRGGFSEAELYETGLAQRNENGRLYDRFRSRIMFPLADVRGKVLGFGARAMREDQRPKYLNTSDNDIYHKGKHVFGVDLARPHAAKAGEVILCEGYTDVIALHQAGVRNVVGLMGTALTEGQVRELARMSNVLLLALDADSAGQEAMLKAFQLANKNKRELRMVMLPQGTDPADLVQRDGVAALEAAVRESVPFASFRTEHVLASGDPSNSEEQDRMIDELRPVFAELPPSALRMELTRTVDSRMALPEGVAEKLLAAPTRAAQRPGDPGRGDGRRDGRGEGRGEEQPQQQRARQPRVSELTRREETERAFLALCIASPEDGELALAGLDIDEHFSSGLLRRAARHLLAGDLRAPMSDAPGAGERVDDDPQLKGLLAELVVEAGRERADTAMLEVQRLQLELARVDRQIQRARGRDGGDISALAQRKAEVKRDFDRAYVQVLEQTGDREG
ncbi:MAG TPA: DNA primase [Solirubrobacteraceae bacterium]|nr:DNA primase [Solirubrobacteraceae bacterium]